MNRGFSLIEFAVATSFFLVLILTGYGAVSTENDLLAAMIARTRPEEESNYRLLVIGAFFQNASAQFKKNFLLQETPFFFPDLQFGQKPVVNEFSIARPLSDPIPFERDLNAYRIPLGIAIQPGNLVVLSGVNGSSNFDWNYARILKVTPDVSSQILNLQFLLARTQLDSGVLAETEIHGFSFRNQYLYWISPKGQPSPYFGKLDAFSYQWSPPQLKIFWQKGLITSDFTIWP